MGAPDLGLETHAGRAVGHVRLTSGHSPFLAFLLHQLVLADQCAVNGVGPYDWLAGRVERRCTDRSCTQRFGWPILAVASATSSDTRILAAHV